MAKPANAGPFTIGLDSELAAGENRVLEFENIDGPYGGTGKLQKYYGRKGGLDYCYIVNSGDTRVAAHVTGGEPTDVPSATSVNLQGSAVRRVTVINTSDTAVPANDIDVNVGNNDRPSERGNGNTVSEWSLNQAVEDLIPGVR